ncbi:hypothetical protein BT69DRAFT_876581 [Atractiella rhizophila]|nr:hypothetical protein BT69DRAFT_876581 [Atractiella rhizophila]
MNLKNTRLELGQLRFSSLYVLCSKGLCVLGELPIPQPSTLNEERRDVADVPHGHITYSSNAELNCMSSVSIHIFLLVQFRKSQESAATTMPLNMRHRYHIQRPLINSVTFTVNILVCLFSSFLPS